MTETQVTLNNNLKAAMEELARAERAHARTGTRLQKAVQSGSRLATSTASAAHAGAAIALKKAQQREAEARYLSGHDGGLLQKDFTVAPETRLKQARAEVARCRREFAAADRGYLEAVDSENRQAMEETARRRAFAAQTLGQAETHLAVCQRLCGYEAPSCPLPRNRTMG